MGCSLVPERRCASSRAGAGVLSDSNQHRSRPAGAPRPYPASVADPASKGCTICQPRVERYGGVTKVTTRPRPPLVRVNPLVPARDRRVSAIDAQAPRAASHNPIKQLVLILHAASGTPDLGRSRYGLQCQARRAHAWPERERAASVVERARAVAQQRGSRDALNVDSPFVSQARHESGESPAQSRISSREAERGS